MSRILPALIAFILCARPVAAEVSGGTFNVQYERTFRGYVTVLAATDQYLFVSDSGPDPADTRPELPARQAKDGSIQGYSADVRQSIIRLLLCNRLTGEIVHEFPGPVSRLPRVSGFELPLTSLPVFLDDGFVFLTADWHLQRIKLPAADAKPVQVWDLDIPRTTKLTPRLNDDIGYLMPAVTRCDDALAFTFNAAPAESPSHLTLVAVNAVDGKLRWVRTLGPCGPLDRSATCVPLGGGRFAVVTPTGDLQTFSLDGDIQHAFRPAGEYQPSELGGQWGGDLWELFRVEKNRVLAFAGQHVEFGKEEPFPLCCVSTGADGGMKVLWQSRKLHGSIAAPAVGTNLYLRSWVSLTAFSIKTKNNGPDQ